MLVGPNLIKGLNFFFFDATTEQFLGFFNLPDYDNIRQFATLDGQLYAAVGKTLSGGAVLKWTGKVGPGCSSCLSFKVVGTLDGIGAYITPHEGRLFVTTESACGYPDWLKTNSTPSLTFGRCVVRRISSPTRTP